MISNLELRQIIESGFLPLKCVCTIDPQGRIAVTLYHSKKCMLPSFRKGLPLNT